MPQEVNLPGGYSEDTLEVLSRSNVVIGDRIIVRTRDGEISGTLMPRYESADKKHIVIKLSNGYNIGIRVSKIVSIHKVGQRQDKESSAKLPDNLVVGIKSGLGPSLEEPKRSSAVDEEKFSLPKIALISTGGTIASKIDYRTGGVKSSLSAVELYEIVPELAEYARIEPDVLMNEYSENLNPHHWSLIATRIFEKINSESYRGVIISHGTDTMHYSASALSFALQNLPIPVVLVGAQRSSDRPSSDAALNLFGATLFALKSNLPGVYVAMHAGTSDDLIACHIGTRVRKNHTSRRDAFESIDTKPVAIVNGKNVIIQNKSERGATLKVLDFKSNRGSFSVKPEFDPRAVLLKFYPGFDPTLISYLVSSGHRAIVLEGTGLGHVSKDCFTEIRKALDSGLLVFMTSQCIWGRTGMTVYDTGRDLLDIGVIPLDDMLPETAIVKAMWVLANSTSLELAKSVMQKNIAHEISPVSPII